MYRKFHTSGRFFALLLLGSLITSYQLTPITAASAPDSSPPVHDPLLYRIYGESTREGVRGAIAQERKELEIRKAQDEQRHAAQYEGLAEFKAQLARDLEDGEARRARIDAMLDKEKKWRRSWTGFLVDNSEIFLALGVGAVTLFKWYQGKYSATDLPRSAGSAGKAIGGAAKAATDSLNPAELAGNINTKEAPSYARKLCRSFLEFFRQESSPI